tara:strand:+ start:271 stop:540 length:270 start_codon:yes stop_codon:yes gene_type:complete
MGKPFFKKIKFYEIPLSLYSFIIDATNHSTIKNETEYSSLIGITKMIQMVDAIKPALAKISSSSNNFFNRFIHKSTKPNNTIMQNNVNY